MTPELIEALEALMDMALQYLEDSEGKCDHYSMSAGENCMDVLSKYGLLKNDELDYKQLAELRKGLNNGY